jgi:hypothetical protein
MQISLESASKTTFESAAQLTKHFSPTVSTAAGMQIECRTEHFAKARLSIRESFEPASKMTVESASQSAKQYSPSTSTAAGMHIDERTEHCINANCSRHESFESDSKVTDDSTSQSEKQYSPITSTDAEMTADESAGQLRNAESSMRLSFEPGSMMRREMLRKTAKQPDPIVSTSIGIQTVSLSPKYRLRQTPSKSRRKSPATLKFGFAGSTEMWSRQRLESAAEPNSQNRGGRQIDETRVAKKARSSRRRSWDPYANVIVEKTAQPEKQSTPSVSTAEGM